MHLKILLEPHVDMSFNETLIPAKQVLKFLSNITFNVENCIFGILYIHTHIHI